jgi:Putative sensor
MAEPPRAAYGVPMATVAAGQRISGAPGTPAPLRWLALLIRNLVFVISSIPVQLAGLGLLALSWLIPDHVPAGFWPVLATLALGAGLVLLARLPLTFIERHRCWSVVGVEIPSPPAARGTSLPRRLGNSLRSEATWRQLGYHLVVGPIMAGGGC